MAIKLIKADAEATVSKKTDLVDVENVTTVPEMSYVGKEEPAVVTVGAGMTKNLGDFNSAKVSVQLSLPCANNPKDIQEAFEMASEFCDEKITEMLGEENPTL